LTQHVTCSLNSSVQTAYIATYSVLYAYSTLYAAQNNVLSIPGFKNATTVNVQGTWESRTKIPLWGSSYLCRLVADLLQTDCRAAAAFALVCADDSVSRACHHCCKIDTAQTCKARRQRHPTPAYKAGHARKAVSTHCNAPLLAC
jgi:hypothetical protein